MSQLFQPYLKKSIFALHLSATKEFSVDKLSTNKTVFSFL